MNVHLLLILLAIVLTVLSMVFPNRLLLACSVLLLEVADLVH